MERALRMAFLTLRHWSGKVAEFPEDALLFEQCEKIAEPLRFLLEPEQWPEAEWFWRGLCIERYPGLDNFFSHVGKDDLLLRAQDFYTIVDAVGCGYLDKELRAQTIEICTCIGQVCDSILGSKKTSAREPTFATYLGKPRLTLAVSR